MLLPAAGDGAHAPAGGGARLRRAALLGALLLAMPPAAVAAAPSAAAPPARNLLVITLDTTRADHLSTYGGPAAVPALDRLAAEGVVFARAFAPAPITLPSHVSLFTGLYPAGHGVRYNGTYRLGDGAVTLAEILRDQGFRCGAVIGSRILDARYGLDQGFDEYDDQLPREDAVRELFIKRPATEVSDRGLAWLRSRGPERWFLWLHYFDPHWEYAPPEPFRSRYPDSPYDGELAYADSQIGRVLDFLRDRGWLDATLVVVAGDHGEGLGDHGESSHGLFIYDSTMHVPLLMRHPATLGRGRTVAPVTRLVDVVPTALEGLGIPHDPVAFHGSTLLPLVAGREDAPRTAWMEAWMPRAEFGWSDLAGLRDRDWKYVRAPRPELYDLQEDPGERRDRSEAEPRILAAYRARLADMERSLTPAEGSTPGSAQDLDPQARRAMESLGYVSLGTGTGKGPLPDPKDRLEEFEKIQTAMKAIHAGRDEEAIPLLQDLAAANPQSPNVRRYLGNALRRAGRSREAVRELRRSLDLDPRDFGTFHDLGAAYLDAGETAKAGEAFEVAIGLNPHLPTTLHNLGLIAQGAGRLEEAAAYYERALEEEPELLRSLVNLGTLKEKAGRREDAAALYLRAAQVDPDSERYYYSAAFLLFEAERYIDALRALDEAQQAHPRSPRPALLRARIHRRMGDREAAERDYRAALALVPDHPEALRGLAELQQQGPEGPTQ